MEYAHSYKPDSANSYATIEDHPSEQGKEYPCSDECTQQENGQDDRANHLEGGHA